MIKRRKKMGLSLIEILVTIAIVAIIAAIGYPQYKNTKYVTRRSYAHSELNKAYANVERFLIENNRTRSSLVAADITANFADYASTSVSPVLSTGNYYRIIIDPASTGDGYSIRAYATVTGGTTDCTNVANTSRMQCPDLLCRQILIDNNDRVSINSNGDTANAATTKCW